MKDNITNQANRLGRRKIITWLGTAGTLGLLGLSKKDVGFFPTSRRQIDSDNNMKPKNNNSKKMKTIGIL